MAPRNRQGATTNSRSTNRAALLAITTTLSRETNYRHNLKQIHARNKHLATQLGKSLYSRYQFYIPCHFY